MRVVDDVEHRDHRFVAVAGANFDLGERLETLATINLAVAVHVGDVFAVGIDSYPA